MNIEIDYIKKVNGYLLLIAYGGILFAEIVFLLFGLEPQTMLQVFVLGAVFLLPTALYIIDSSSRYIKYTFNLAVVVYVYGMIYLQHGAFDNTYLLFIMIAISTLYFDIGYTIFSTVSLIVVTVIAYSFFKDTFFPYFDRINLLTLLISFSVVSMIVSLQSYLSRLIMRRNIDLYRKGIHDHLTGVYNRAFFDSYLIDSFTMLEFVGQPISIILIDLDDFKNINDTFGHLEGDEVLKKAANAIKTVCRNSDFVARYGGEEFVLVCRGTGLDSAALLAEKIRANIEDKVKYKNGKVTASLGVASLSVTDPSKGAAEQAKLLFESADSKLYESKANGKNRYTI